MEGQPRISAGSSVQEKINLSAHSYGKYRVLFVFLVCGALLIAIFAISGIWLEGDGENAWLDRFGGFFGSQKEQNKTEANSFSEYLASSGAATDAAPPSMTPFPEGAIPILEADLSYLSLGENYILNQTPYSISVDELLQRDVSASAEARSSGGPLVLILHSHAGEAYLSEELDYIEGNVGDMVYSRNEEENVLTVGRALQKRLNEKGITAIHCTVMHDAPSMQGSYDRAAESIRFYLEMYPSIEYVIDLHRDSVSDAEGNYLKSIAPGGEEPTAQIMAVVGSDCNGTEYDWESNLALALKLRQVLNYDGKGIARPVFLRTSSFHQELAKHSLLLEIGTGANSVEEALRTVEPLADALESVILP